MADTKDLEETRGMNPSNDGSEATLIKSAYLDATLFKTPDGHTAARPCPESDLQETLIKEVSGAAGEASVPASGQPVPPGKAVIDAIYRLEEVIGEGAMGTVSRVFHLGWKIDLAVKTIRVDRTSPELLKLFLKEAETWMELAKHPHISTAFYIRDFQGSPAVFLEYIDGGSLGAWLKQGKLPDLREKLRVALQCCDGMIYAHSRSLIHRDLKPENVLMLKDGTVKITDFGLARKLSGTATGDGPEDADLETCGTPAYMPPEQWSAASKATVTADVYSFGVMLFEILTERRPFVLDPDDPRPPELAWRMMHGRDTPPLLSQVDPSLPTALDAILARCLNKDPGSRFSGFAELREHLLAVYQTISGDPYSGIDFDPEKHRANDLNNRALSFLDLGNEKRAEEVWQAALKAEPYHAAANANLAQLYWKRNFITYGPSIATLHKNLIEVDPELGLLQKGILQLRSGSFDEALATLASPRLTTPESPARANIRGLAYLSLACSGAKNRSIETIINGVRHVQAEARPSQQSLWESSHQSFLKAAELAPHHPGYPQNLSHVLRKMDLPHEADKYQAKARQLGIDTLPHSAGNPDAVWNLHAVLHSTCQCLGSAPIMISPRRNLFYVREGKVANSFEAREFDLRSGKAGGTLEGVDCFWGEIPGRNQFLSGTLTVSLKDFSTGKTAKKLLCKNLDQYIRSLKSVGPSMYDLITVALSPNERLLIGVRRNSTLEIWNMQNFTSQATLEGPGYSAITLSFIDDGQILLGCADGKIRLLEATRFSIVKESADLAPAITGCLVSPDRTSFYTGSADGMIRRWDTQTLACIQELAGHTAGILALAFTPGKKHLLSSSGDRTMKVWNLQSDRLEKTFDGFERNLTVTHSTFSPDGHFLAFVSTRQAKVNTPSGLENCLHLWKIFRNEDLEPPIFVETPDPVFCRVTTVAEDVSFGQRFQTILEQAQTLLKQGDYASGYQKILEARQIPGFQENPELKALLRSVQTKGQRKALQGAFQEKDWSFPHTPNPTFSQDGRYIASLENSHSPTGQPSHTVVVKSTHSPESPRKFGPHLYQLRLFFFPPEKDLLICCDSLGLIYHWDLTSGNLLRTLVIPTNHPKPNQCFLSPCGTYALWISQSSMIQRFEFSTLGMSPLQDLPETAVYQVSFSSDGRFFGFIPTQRAVSPQKPTPLQLHVWDSRTMKPILAIPGNIARFLFGPGDTLWLETPIAGCPGGDSIIEQWSLNSGEKLLSLPGPANHHLPWVFSPNHRHLAKGAQNGIRLWDLSGNLPPQLLQWPQNTPISLHFSPDGRFLIAGGGNGKLSIWDVGTGILQREVPIGAPLSVSTDFSFLIGKASDNCFQLYNMEWDWEFPDLPATPAPSGPETSPGLASDLAGFLQTATLVEQESTVDTFQRSERALFLALRLREELCMDSSGGLSPEIIRTKRLRLIEAFIGGLEKRFSPETAEKVDHWVVRITYLGRLISGDESLQAGLGDRFRSFQSKVVLPLLQRLFQTVAMIGSSPELNEEMVQKAEKIVESALLLAGVPGFPLEISRQAVEFRESRFDLSCRFGETQLEQGHLEIAKRFLESADLLATELMSSEKKGRVFRALIQWTEKAQDHPYFWHLKKQVQDFSWVLGPSFAAQQKEFQTAFLKLCRKNLEAFFRDSEGKPADSCPGNPLGYMRMLLQETGDPELAKEIEEYQSKMDLIRCEAILQRLEAYLATLDPTQVPDPREVNTLLPDIRNLVKKFDRVDFSERFLRIDQDIQTRNTNDRSRKELAGLLPTAWKFLDGEKKRLSEFNGINPIMKKTLKASPPARKGLIPAFEYPAVNLQRALKLTEDLKDNEARGEILELLSQVHLLGNDEKKAEFFFRELETGDIPNKDQRIASLKKAWETQADRLLTFTGNNLEEGIVGSMLFPDAFSTFAKEAEGYFQNAQPIVDFLKDPGLQKKFAAIKSHFSLIPEILKVQTLVKAGEIKAAEHRQNEIRDQVNRANSPAVRSLFEQMDSEIAAEKEKRGFFGNLFGR
jgi:serine/threonine protein kinase/WD40 repeat protein